MDDLRGSAVCLFGAQVASALGTPGARGYAGLFGVAIRGISQLLSGDVSECAEDLGREEPRMLLADAILGRHSIPRLHVARYVFETDRERQAGRSI